MKKYYDGQYTGQKSLIEGKEYYRFVITTNDIDRMGDIVDLEGLDTSEYERNPIVLYNHYSMPIGKSFLTKASNVIYGDVWFDETDDLSKTIKRKVDAGVITHASIGFEVLEHEERELTESEKSKIKRNWIKRIKTFTKSILLEWSVVDLPANINAALQKQLENKEFKENLIKFIDEGNMEIEQKKGSTLSKKNKALLQTAMDSIKEVLNEPEATETDEAKQIDIDEIKTLLSEFMSEIEQIKKELAESKKKKIKLTDIY